MTHDLAFDERDDDRRSRLSSSSSPSSPSPPPPLPPSLSSRATTPSNRRTMRRRPQRTTTSQMRRRRQQRTTTNKKRNGRRRARTAAKVVVTAVGSAAAALAASSSSSVAASASVPSSLSSIALDPAHRSTSVAPNDLAFRVPRGGGGSGGGGGGGSEPPRGGASAEKASASNKRRSKKTKKKSGKPSSQESADAAGETKDGEHEATKKGGKTTSERKNKKEKDQQGGPSPSTTTADDQQHSSASTPPHTDTLPPEAQSILDASCHYSALGVERDACATTITRAYRRKCVVTHPDKLPTGDRRAFDRVAKAYEVLNDEEKRALYDRYGDEGVEKGGNPNGGPFGFNFGSAMGGAGGGGFRSFSFGTGGMGGGVGGGKSFQEEILKSFFGVNADAGGGPSAARERMQRPFAPRNRDMRYQLEVTLEDLYAGASRDVTITQPTAGQHASQHHPPPHPLGGGARMEKKTVHVHIPPGAQSGTSIRLSGEIDGLSNAAPADAIFVLAQRRHPTFVRKGDDLMVEMTISLKEALCGLEREVKHLDGRTVVVRSARSRAEESEASAATNKGTNKRKVEQRWDGGGEEEEPKGQKTTEEEEKKEEAEKEEEEEEIPPPVIIRTGDVHVLRGEGMPRARQQQHAKGGGAGDGGGGGVKGGERRQSHGDLYVRYVVQMPEEPKARDGSSSRSRSRRSTTLTSAERTELGRLLDKLEGHSEATAAKTASAATKESSQSSSTTASSASLKADKRDDDDGEDPQQNKAEEGKSNNKEESNAQYLEVAPASDFGKRSRHLDDENDGDSHLRRDEDDEEYGARTRFFHPFGGVSRRSGGGFQYFSSSGFGTSSAFQHPDEEGDDEEDHGVQCQQM